MLEISVDPQKRPYNFIYKLQRAKIDQIFLEDFFIKLAKNRNMSEKSCKFVSESSKGPKVPIC